MLHLLKTDIGIAFNTTILRIALNLEEEKISNIIVNKYETRIEEEMIIRAIKTS